jgi:adenine-specific DNA-methyltransferase
VNKSPDNAVDPQSIQASLDVVGETRRQLMALVPSAFSEGQLDLSALRALLGESHVAEAGERYALTWAGKGDAYKVLQTPTRATLRPQRDLSINFDEAQHAFIEGENLEVLKVLQKAYFAKINLIYIDPPYNTGSDSFVYPDRFQESKEEYLKRINDLSDDGTLMREGYFQKNSKENGRYHSNWLSMMLPRLYIARNLLRDDGVIFVSCDDNEVHNLRCVMEEVFGDDNFVAIICWKNVTDNNPTLINKDNEFILCFAKNKTALPQAWKSHFSESKELLQAQYDAFKAQGLKPDEIQSRIRDFIGDNVEVMGNLTRYKFVDEDGIYTGSESVHNPRPGGYDFEIEHPDTKRPMRKPANGYRFPFETFKEMDNQKRILYGEDEKRIVKIKKYLSEFEDTLRSVIVMDGRLGSYDFKRLFSDDEKLFNNPKPVDLILQLASYVTDRDSIVLDMFAGSCTTAESILRLNQMDGGQRKVICVQLPERTPEGSPAAKAGYATIADIGRERIRRVVEKLKSAADLVSPVQSGLGVKSFLLTPSNFKQWRGDGIEDTQTLAAQIEMFIKAEKDGTAPENILYELLLKLGRPITSPIEKLKLGDAAVFSVGERKTVFVLETFSLEMIEPLLALKPEEIIAIDSVFHDSDELKSNLTLQCRDAGVRFLCI